MSFGFSVGDFIAVGQLAWNVYKSCRDAPESFSNISIEVLSLHAVLKSAEESLADQVLSESRHANLETISTGCRKTLQDLQALVDKYESLGTKTKRTFDRMGWVTNDIAELRARLTSNVVMLNTFLRQVIDCTSQPVVEKKLNKLIQEFKDGQHEGSIMTVATVESISLDDKETWRVIRKELEDIGISVAAFDANKAFIMDWFGVALANGSFEEHASDDEDEDVLELESSSEAQNTSSSSEIPTKELSRAVPPNSPGAKLKALPSLPSLKSKVAMGANHSQSTQQTNAKLSPPDAISRIPDRRGGSASPASAKKKAPRVVPLVAWMLRYNVSFLAACQRDDVLTAGKLLDKGASINAEDKNGTALYSAWQRRSLLTMAWLLKRGAEAETLVFRETLEAREFAAASLLLEHGSNIDIGYDDGDFTPLIRFSRLGNREVVRFLLEHGASVNAMGPNGGDRTALYCAIQRGHEIVVQDLLDHQAGTEVIARQEKNNSAVVYALSMKFDRIAIRIIRAGGAGHLQYHPRLLHLAAEMGCIATASLLIANGWDINQKDSPGLTPLDYAVASQDSRMVELLLEEGATVDYQSRLSSLSGFGSVLVGYETLKSTFRKYPHPAKNPKTLYSGDH